MQRRLTTFFNLGGKSETPSKSDRVRSDSDRLWKTKQALIKKETLTQEEIRGLRSLIVETLDLAGRIRVQVREKENYTNEDVISFSKDLSTLQLLFHGVLEIWAKAKDPDRKSHKSVILPDMMELSTDLCSIFGETMSIFLQRFNLDNLPLLRPVHGLFYCLSMHCRFNCLDKDVIFSDGAPTVYSGFLSSVLGLLRSSKVLLKRLIFEDDQSRQRRRMIQSNITTFVTDISFTIKEGLYSVSTEEYRQLVYKIGGLCTDTFFTIGRTKGIAEHLEMGEGVLALKPGSNLGDISNCDIIRCPIEKRVGTTKNLSLQEGQIYISDIFLTTGSTFQCEEKILIRFPVANTTLPPSSTVKVKIKCGQKWIDTGAEIKEGHAEFWVNYMEAFVAVAGFRAYHREITPDGYTYTSEEDTRVRINFPEGCLSKPTIVKFRLIQVNRNRMFAYKEQCPDACKSVIALSDILHIRIEDDVEIKQPALVHLPIINDVDDPESEICLFRRTSDGDIELGAKWGAMKCESTGNCYTFQINKFDGIALGKVKPKYLKKQKEVIAEEFDLYYQSEHVCCILTFMDKNLLHLGMVKLWIEVCEKRFAKRVIRRRAKEGLFEIPGSRSQDVLLSDLEYIRMDLDGNMQKIRELPIEHYMITFLTCARDNYRSFPVEPRKDPRGRQVGIINYFKDVDGIETFVHSATIDTNRFLVSVSNGSTVPRLPTSYAETRPAQISRQTALWSRGSSRSSGKSAKSTVVYRSIFDEVPILSHQSLLILSGSMSMQVAQSLGVQLGLKYEDILDRKSVNQPQVVTIFEILWTWRGKQASSEMVGKLAGAFMEINQKHFADIIFAVWKEKRALRRSDFN